MAGADGLRSREVTGYFEGLVLQEEEDEAEPTAAARQTELDLANPHPNSALTFTQPLIRCVRSSSTSRAPSPATASSRPPRARRSCGRSSPSRPPSPARPHPPACLRPHPRPLARTSPVAISSRRRPFTLRQHRALQPAVLTHQPRAASSGAGGPLLALTLTLTLTQP